MAEQIGLQATFDDDAWRRGTDAYMDRVSRMNDLTGRMAGSIGQSFVDLGKSITAATGVMAAAVGGVVALGAKELAGWTAEGIQGAIALEQRIADIGSVLGKTGEEIGPLGDLLDELALDPQLVVGTDEAADAIENLARNGLTMDQILDGAARSVVLLANATGGSFATSADVATDMLGQFNLEVGDLGKAVDIAQGVINSSKFTLDDWRLALAQGGGVAGSVGVELEDFAAAIAGTSHLFGSGSDAGTSFKTMLQRLVPQSKEAADEMRRLGLFSGQTTGEFEKTQGKLQDLQAEMAALDPASENYAEKLAKLQAEQAELTKELVKGGSAFFDSEGNMKSMAEIAGALEQAFGGLSEAQRVEAMTTIFGSDAMRSAVGLMDLGAEGLAGVRAEVVKLGSAEQAASVRMDTLNAQMSILSDQWETIQRKSGSQFADTLKNIVKWLNDLTERVGERVVALFGNLAELMDTLWQRAQPILDKFLPVFIDDLEALSNYLLAVASDGDTMNDWLTHMSPGLRTLVERVTAGWEAFQRFREILGAVVERVAGFLQPLTDWIAKHVELQDVLIVAGAAVAAFVAPLALAIAKMAAVGAAATAAVALIRTAWETDFGGVRTFLQQTWEQISGIFATGLQIVQEIWGRLTSAVSGNGEVLTNLLTLPWENFKTYLGAALEVIQNLLDIVLAAIQGDWGRVWQEVKDTFQVTWDAIKEVFTRTWDALSAALETYLPPLVAKLGEWGTALWNWIVEVTPVVLAKLGEWAGALWDWITANAPKWAETLKAWATAAWEWIAKVTPQAVDKLQAWGSALWGWVSDNAPIWYEKLKGWAEAAWKWITETAIPTAKEKIVEWGTALWTWITDNAPQWLEKLQSWAEAAWQWLVDVTPTAVEKLAEWGEALWTWVATNAPTWGEKLAEWGTAAWEWLVEATTTAVEKLGEWGTALLTWLGDNLPEFLAQLVKWAAALVDWIGESLPKAIEAFGDWLVGVVEWLGDNLPEFLAQLVKWAAALVNWIAESLPKAIEAFGKWIVGVVEWMTGDAETQGKGGIKKGVGEWVKALWQWVMTDLWPTLEPELTKLGTSIGTALGNIVTSITEAAKNIGTAIVQGTIDGINAKWDALVERVTKLGDLVPQTLIDLLRIDSPSKVFQHIGEMTGLGFNIGIGDELAKAQAVVARTFDDMGQVMNTMTWPTASVIRLGEIPAPHLSDRYANWFAQRGGAVPSYSTTNYSSSVGPFYVNTPMDLAEMEWRIERIVTRML